MHAHTEVHQEVKHKGRKKLHVKANISRVFQRHQCNLGHPILSSSRPQQVLLKFQMQACIFVTMFETYQCL